MIRTELECKRAGKIFHIDTKPGDVGFFNRKLSGCSCTNDCRHIYFNAKHHPDFALFNANQFRGICKYKGTK